MISDSDLEEAMAASNRMVEQTPEEVMKQAVKDFIKTGKTPEEAAKMAKGALSAGMTLTFAHRDGFSLPMLLLRKYAKDQVKRVLEGR